MRITQHYALPYNQAEVDFVDVELSTDSPLFIDPFAISIRDDHWSNKCNDHISSFFGTALNRIQRGDLDSARKLFNALREPNETRLGLSKNAPAGRGVGRIQADQLFNSLVDSRAAQTGQLSDLSETSLFVRGVGPDKVSDITTNLIRGPLCEYTLEQCNLFGIPTESVPAGLVWNPSELRWESQYRSLPIHGERPLLMVPKHAVRRQIALDSQEMYNHYILSFLQAEHISSHSSLVVMLKSGPRVTKVSLKAVYPFSKDFISEFLADNPQVLESYKRIKGAIGALTPRELVEDFREDEFASTLIEALRDIPTGMANSSRYHRFMVGCLHFIFHPNLIVPKMEREINSGRKRIDIAYTNGARSGFFHRIHTAHQISSIEIMVECKNYSSELGNPEIDQLLGRFSVNRGKFGLLLYRSCENEALLTARCRDAAEAQRGFVIALGDADVIHLLDEIRRGERRRIDGILDQKLRAIIG